MTSPVLWKSMAVANSQNNHVHAPYNPYDDTYSDKKTVSSVKDVLIYAASQFGNIDKFAPSDVWKSKLRSDIVDHVLINGSASRNLTNFATPEDDKKATDLRKHYSISIGTLIIQNEEITDWQKEVFRLLSITDTGIDLSGREVDVLVSLFLFYQSTRLKTYILKKAPPSSPVISSHISLVNAELIFICDVLSYRKNYRSFSCYFEYNKGIYSFKLGDNAEYIRLFKSCIRDGKIIVSGSAVTSMNEKHSIHTLLKEFKIEHRRY